jgi:hypothetical protein
MFGHNKVIQLDPKVAEVAKLITDFTKTRHPEMVQKVLTDKVNLPYGVSYTDKTHGIDVYAVLDKNGELKVLVSSYGFCKHTQHEFDEINQKLALIA